MKALLVSFGTRGDIEPFLAVGEILRERGWEVVCLFPEQFRGEPIFESQLIDLYYNDDYKQNAEQLSQQMANEADRDKLFDIIAEIKEGL